MGGSNMSDMMNNPFLQSIINNPNVMQSFVRSNPAIREVNVYFYYNNIELIKYV